MKKIISPGIKLLFISVLFFVLCGCSEDTDKSPLNIVILTLDDMGYGTTGVEGCTVPAITPNIDKLASEGILFSHGYVITPICGPSRAAILTGRYPHRSGMMGHGRQPPEFWEEPEIKTPSISTYLHGHGYTTGAILKMSRTEYLNTWDVNYNELPFGVGFHDRNPDSFYKRTKAFIERAKKNNKPFFLYANPIDPHPPWDDTPQEVQKLAKWNPQHRYPEPSRKYSADQVEVPAFLIDLPDIRRALVPYYNALHRGDECIGAILKAIDESEAADNTLIIFLSDNGMGAPGAKSTLYQDGIRTPIIMRWPDRIKKGVVDKKSIVSSIDIVPTIIEAVGLPALSAIEGKSVYEVITGRRNKTDRDYAYAAFNYQHESSEDEFFPHRAIINETYCYIWNSFVVRSGGTKQKSNGWMDVVESSLAENGKLKRKISFMENRPVEEFYDLSKDPGCWDNLIDRSDYQKQITTFRHYLKKEMLNTSDPERFYYKF